MLDAELHNLAANPLAQTALPTTAERYLVSRQSHLVAL
jgi:hypothetical protein